MNNMNIFRLGPHDEELYGPWPLASGYRTAIMTTNTETKLKIVNLHYEDMGKYTLVAELDDLKKTVEYNIEVYGQYFNIFK